MMTVRAVLRLQKRCERLATTAGLRVGFVMWCHEPRDDGGLERERPVWTLGGTLRGAGERVGLSWPEDLPMFEAWLARHVGGHAAREQGGGSPCVMSLTPPMP